MRCTWSANSLVGLGVLALVLSAAGSLSRTRPELRMSAISLAGVFALALLVPTKLIGMCGAPTHACRAATLPAVLAEAGLGLVFALAAALISSLGETNFEGKVPGQ